MKKDITIPKVEKVHVAAVKEFNKDFNTEEWNIYLINEGTKDLVTVLIVSNGFDEDRETSVMRYRIEKLPAKSFAKIEFLQEGLLQLNNEFRISYFQDSKMFDKKYIFVANSIDEKGIGELPVIPKRGVLGK